MARFKDVVFDCRHPASLARFWAAALDGYRIAPYDGTEPFDPEDDPTVLIEGGSPRLWFQLVPESKIVKNRVHLDVRCDDLDAESRRLTALGARVVEYVEDWIVMADPEGNEFCLQGP
ncbi:VOC family protein [Nonomuraea dietziae]|uniref:VOC family protein n=1 Tax=Nonomuraea dietziae TaxID=65515 RepID=UPI0034484888